MNLMLPILAETVSIPYTADYLLLGLGVVGAVVVLYVLSLVMRFRQAQREIAQVEALDKGGR